MDKSYYVYILTNKWNTVLYIGVTSDPVRRIYEHKNKLVSGFTKTYDVHKLVYYGTFAGPTDAIAREKQLKAGPRKRKVALIEKTNPKWADIYDEICR